MGMKPLDERATLTVTLRLHDRGDAMRKTLTAIAAAATIGVATLATPTTADARWGWWGPALGGFAAGAIIGSALASPYYYGGYYPAHPPPPPRHHRHYPPAPPPPLPPP